MISKWFFLSIALFLAFALITFLYFATSTFPYEKPPRPAAVEELLSGTSSLQSDHISYFLSELGAYQLHNPPASSDTPKIEVVLDSRVYTAEVIAGQLITEEKQAKEVDIRIISSQEEIIQAIKSGEVKNYIKRSISGGKTKIDQIGSYSKLFSKGYLNLYNELTEKSMTGNIISIFSER